MGGFWVRLAPCVMHTIVIVALGQAILSLRKGGKGRDFIYVMFKMYKIHNVILF